METITVEFKDTGNNEHKITFLTKFEYHLRCQLEIVVYDRQYKPRIFRKILYSKLDISKTG
jgi:hypothetical protein